MCIVFWFSTANRHSEFCRESNYGENSVGTKANPEKHLNRGVVSLMKFLFTRSSSICKS